MNKPIKLLFVIDFFKTPYAGTEGQLLKLIQNLNKDNFEANFVVFRNSDYLKENDFPVPFDIVNIQRLSSPLNWLKLFRYFLIKKRDNYSLAHIFFNDASLICPLLLKILGYKVVISRRDMGYWHSWRNFFLLRINTLFVDLVITNSESVKKITMNREGYKSEHVAVIYNGYQESTELSITDSTVKENNLCFDDREIKIVLVANIRTIKRISDAIRAIKVILSSNYKISLYIIGDGDQSQLIKLSNTLGTSLSVHFCGSRDNILQLLSHFHVGILCSESEGFSNTLIEYMQSGLPVVCSNVGGNPEIIDHGINGFLYKKGDIPSLAKYILELAMNDRLRERMGKAGMKKVGENYSLTKYVDHHQYLYERLLSK